jgi:hypothetical protein
VKAWNFFYTDQEVRAIHQGRNERVWLDIEGVPRKMRLGGFLASTGSWEAVLTD